MVSRFRCGDRAVGVAGVIRLLGMVTAALVVATVSAPAASARTGIDPAPAGAEPRIVGGEQVTTNEYPYAVYLVNDDGFQFCGAVLIDADSVLTAAHCAQAVEPDELAVVTGRIDKRTDAGMRVDVTDVWVHPDFEVPWRGDDVAVLTLRHAVPYRAAEVASADDAKLYEPGNMATVVGWGRISEGGARSHVLREAQVPLVSDAECGETFAAYEPGSMVCAGFEDGGVDACQGDSGGPLLVGDRVVGIVSWGRGCARPDTPGIYTRVSAYAEQIARHADATPALVG